MLIDTPSSENFDFFFFTKYLAIMVLWFTFVNWVSYVNVFKPSLKVLFVQLLPEEYLKLTGVVGWKLTAKSWLLRCGEFLPLVLYWVLNKASSNNTLNLLNMRIMIMTGIFILKSLFRIFGRHLWIWLWFGTWISKLTWNAFCTSGKITYWLRSCALDQCQKQKDEILDSPCVPH